MKMSLDKWTPSLKIYWIFLETYAEDETGFDCGCQVCSGGEAVFKHTFFFSALIRISLGQSGLETLVDMKCH